MTRKISICRIKYNKKHKYNNINKYSIQSLKIVLPNPITPITTPITQITTTTITKPSTTTITLITKPITKPSTTTITPTTTTPITIITTPTKPTTTQTSTSTTTIITPTTTTPITSITTSTKPPTTTIITTSTTIITTSITSITTSTKPPTTIITPIMSLQKSISSVVSQFDTLNIQNQERQLKNLKDFTWSNLLEKEAINWSTNLTEFNNCGLTHYLDTAKGQNLYAMYGSTKSNINNAINAWVDEKNLIDKPNVTFDQIGHYLTIISPDFTQVGCGIAINPIQNCLIATCNYS